MSPADALWHSARVPNGSPVHHRPSHQAFLVPVCCVGLLDSPTSRLTPASDPIKRATVVGIGSSGRPAVVGVRRKASNVYQKGRRAHQYRGGQSAKESNLGW